MTGVELEHLALHAYGTAWRRPLAREIKVSAFAIHSWRREGVPKYRVWEIIEVCQARAQYNARAVNRLVNRLKIDLRSIERKRRIAEALKQGRKAKTRFERMRRKALAEYLVYRKKADAAALGHLRRKHRLKLKKQPSHLNLRIEAHV